MSISFALDKFSKSEEGLFCLRYSEGKILTERSESADAQEISPASLVISKTPSFRMEKFRNKYAPYRVLLVGRSGIPVEEFLMAEVDKLF